MPRGSGAKLKNNEKKACARKRRFSKARVAREAAEWSSFEFEARFVAYHCRWCDGYHIARADTITNNLRLKDVRLAMQGRALPAVPVTFRGESANG
jgi:hypothetical protein